MIEQEALLLADEMIPKTSGSKLINMGTEEEPRHVPRNKVVEEIAQLKFKNRENDFLQMFEESVMQEAQKRIGSPMQLQQMNYSQPYVMEDPLRSRRLEQSAPQQSLEPADNPPNTQNINPENNAQVLQPIESFDPEMVKQYRAQGFDDAEIQQILADSNELQWSGNQRIMRTLGRDMPRHRAQNIKDQEHQVVFDNVTTAMNQGLSVEDARKALAEMGIPKAKIRGFINDYVASSRMKRNQVDPDQVLANVGL